MASAPVSRPHDDDHSPSDEERFRWHPFDRWCCRRYLCEESGCAELVGVWHSKRLAQKLADELGIPVVDSYSGGESLEQLLQKEAEWKAERKHGAAGHDQQ